MSVSAISTSVFDANSQNVQNKMKQEFQQLGQDLQSGNLSAAQSDFATLQQLAPQSTSAMSQSSNPLAQDFQQLAQDLQSGNLSAAQQDYTKIQQDFQSASGQTHGHHHHHHGGGNSEISQLFQQLGQALQSGDISSAQQLFSTLQQNLQQGGATSSHGTSQSTGVSVTA